MNYIGFRNAKVRDLSLTEEQVKILSENKFLADSFGCITPLNKGCDHMEKSYGNSFIRIKMYVREYQDVIITNYGQDWVKSCNLSQLDEIYKLLNQIREDLKLLRQLGIIK